MPKTVFKIEDGKLGLSTTEPTNADDVALSTVAEYTDFSCQMTQGELQASPNLTAETIPATGCDAEETIQTVGQTSYSIVLGALQDPEVAAGLSRFLFEHDTELVWFFFGMDGDDPPKAIGQVRCVAGTVGGSMRTTLQASVTLPCEAKPSVEFGDATTSVVV
jgi:hypothetical protein